MLSDSARRKAERKRSEALIAQIAGTATSTTPARSGGLLLSSSERPPPRKLTDHGGVVLGGPAPASLAQLSSTELAVGDGAEDASSRSSAPSVLSPRALRFKRYDLDDDGVLDRCGTNPQANPTQLLLSAH